MQKMTTVASPPDARHLKHVLNPQTTNQCHLFPSLQPSDPTAVDGNGGSQLEDWEMSNPPGFCWISSDVSGGRNRDGGGNRRVFVGNLAYSNGLSMSESSESDCWLDEFLYISTYMEAQMFLFWAQRRSTFRKIPWFTSVDRKVWHGKNWKITCAMLGMFCWLPSILPWQCLHEKWWTVLVRLLVRCFLCIDPVKDRVSTGWKQQQTASRIWGQKNLQKEMTNRETPKSKPQSLIRHVTFLSWGSARFWKSLEPP